jgi:hypothetical protein
MILASLGSGLGMVSTVLERNIGEYRNDLKGKYGLALPSPRAA